jgi:hypothetical protein
VESGKDLEHWSGTVRNTCGRADGPAVAVVVREGATSGCADTSASRAFLLLEGQRADSLRAGKDFRDSLNLCFAEGGCPGAIRDHYLLRIEAADAHSAQGTLEIREQDGTSPETVRRVEVDLMKCPADPVPCG